MKPRPTDIPAHKASPIISVIMPAYNHERYVGAAIESVLAQSWQNLELLIVDDASQDMTWEVISSYSDPRIQAIRHQVNQGAHASMNSAISKARGEYLAILNSDDIYLPERIGVCLRHIESEGADIVGTDISLIDADDREIRAHWWINAFDSLKYVYEDTGDWMAALLEGNLFMTTSNFFFRRSLYNDIGEFNDYRYVHDYDFLLRALIADKKLTWIDSPLLHYRLHGENTITDRPMQANLESANLLRKHAPVLLGYDGSLTTRLTHLASQWARIERYICEISAAQCHAALVAKERDLFRLIDDRDQWIAERDRMIVDRDQWIAERDRMIVDRDQWIAERDRMIADRDEWISERDRVIATHTRSLAACQTHIEAIYNSRSYRIGAAVTAPARWCRMLMQSARTKS